MRKRYHSKSCVSVSVKMPKGAKRIVFLAQSDGSSVYYTDNEDEQRGLEHHARYGEWFEGSEVKVEEEPVAESMAIVDDESVLREVQVSDMESARAMLAEHYGVSRTRIRTIKAIDEVAETKGIKFVWPGKE